MDKVRRNIPHLLKTKSIKDAEDDSLTLVADLSQQPPIVVVSFANLLRATGYMVLEKWKWKSLEWSVNTLIVGGVWNSPVIQNQRTVFSSKDQRWYQT